MQGSRRRPSHPLQEHARDRHGHQEDGPRAGEDVPRGGDRDAPLRRLPPLLRRRRPHRAGEERGLHQRPGQVAQEVRGDAARHPQERRVQRRGALNFQLNCCKRDFSPMVGDRRGGPRRGATTDGDLERRD